jgi:prepilin-type processing-associated H-X9-DG protein
MLTCPSNPPEVPGQPWTNYVGNAGQAFSDSTRTGTAINNENPADGIFFDDNKNINFGPADNRESHNRLQMSLGYVQANDGTSKTFLFSESLHVYYWCYDIEQAGLEWVQRQGSNAIFDTKHLFGFVWKNPVPPSQPASYERINGDRYYDQNPSPDIASPTNPLKEWSGSTPTPGQTAPATYESYGYPSSNHPGGVNMAYCGGQITFVIDQIDPVVYAQLMTPRRITSSLVSNNTPERKMPPPPDDF